MYQGLDYKYNTKQRECLASSCHGR